MSKAEKNKMPTKHPLPSKILLTLKLAMVVTITKASSWGRCRPLGSSLVKVMGGFTSVVGEERL